MFRLPISSGFSFSASGSCLCAEFFGALVFCGLLCARAGAARSKRLTPSHKLRRADDNLIVILLGSFRFNSRLTSAVRRNARLRYRSSVSDEIVITPYSAHRPFIVACSSSPSLVYASSMHYRICIHADYAVNGRIILRVSETCSKFLINLSLQPAVLVSCKVVDSDMI